MALSNFTAEANRTSRPEFLTKVKESRKCNKDFTESRMLKYRAYYNKAIESLPKDNKLKIGFVCKNYCLGDAVRSCNPNSHWEQGACQIVRKLSPAPIPLFLPNKAYRLARTFHLVFRSGF